MSRSFKGGDWNEWQRKEVISCSFFAFQNYFDVPIDYVVARLLGLIDRMSAQISAECQKENNLVFFQN